MKILALEFSSAQRSVAILDSGAFSLTPALSRWERENDLRANVMTDSEPTPSPSKEGSRISDAPSTEDPLLGGGRGGLPQRFTGKDRGVPAASTGQTICEVIETSAGRTMQPFRMIEAALAQAGLERRAIECIVVGLGPGSYNGIRAGIALAQGWQLAREVKLLGSSSAEAMAEQARTDGWRGVVNVVVDAQRGEWYLGAWELTDAGRREIEPLRIVAADVVRQRAEAGQVILGPEAPRCGPTGRIIFPRAATLARLALGRSDFVSGELLEPIYLRKTTFVKAPPPRII